MDTSRKTCQVCNDKHPRDLHCLKVTSQKNPEESQTNGNDTTGQQKSTHSTLANQFLGINRLRVSRLCSEMKEEHSG